MNDCLAQLRTLYEEAGPEIRAYLRRQTSDPYVADELLQETFYIATKRQDQLSSAVSARAWLFGVARNLCRRQRREKRRSLRLVPLTEEPEANTPPHEDPRLEQMRRHIRMLPEAQRETLELRLVHDLSYADIAIAMGVPVGTVRSRLHNAVRSLRERATETPQKPSPKPPCKRMR